MTPPDDESFFTVGIKSSVVVKALHDALLTAYYGPAPLYSALATAVSGAEPALKTAFAQVLRELLADEDFLARLRGRVGDALLETAAHAAVKASRTARLGQALLGAEKTEAER